MGTMELGSEPVSANRLELTLTGEVDVANASDWRSVALTMLAGSEDCLTVDLSGVTFIDSTGIGMLLEVQTAANEAGMRFQLRGTPERIERLLVITGLAHLFERATA